MKNKNKSRNIVIACGAVIASAALVLVGLNKFGKKKKYGLIDLHIHLDGSLSLDTVYQLADMQNIELPEDDAEIINKMVADKYCKDLNDYLEKFEFPLTLLQTEEAISTAVYNLCEELREQGLLYAEIRFAPQLHTKNGLSQYEIVQAAIEGLNKSSFNANLILCCMRGEDNRKENEETVRIAVKFHGNGVCGLDLAGAEALYPNDGYEYIFLEAIKNDLPFTIHAGEALGPESVSSALDMGAYRLGHGVRASESEEVMKRLAESGVALELCPTSNLDTNVYDMLLDYPLRDFIRTGVKITINTDNTTVSRTSIDEEFERLINIFELTDDQILKMQLDAVDASFADEKTKKHLTKKITKMFK